MPFIPYPTPLHDKDSRLVGAVNMLVDVSERKQAETQRRLLLDELNHRVKNNIQMLSAFSSSAERKANNMEAKLALADTSQRVAAMASAQLALYSAQSASTFNAHEFVHAVCLGAQQAFRLFPKEHKWMLSVEDDGPGFDFKPPKRRSSGSGLVMVRPSSLAASSNGIGIKTKFLTPATR